MILPGVERLKELRGKKKSDIIRPDPMKNQNQPRVISR
jgi:hypothetical protein